MTPRAARSRDAAAGRAGRLAADAATPSRDAADALTFPVAGLLGEPVGTVRETTIDPLWIDAGEDVALAEPVEGHLRLTRTNRGLLVDADLRTALATECSRCLRDITVPLELEIDEEALPSVELASGAPVDTSAEPDVVRLNDHHQLELLPLVREAIWLGQPIAPVCRDDCPGLCVTCGRPLDEGEHDHGAAEIDPRFEALKAFTVDADRESD
jgi:uncharacterized protein